MDRYRLLKGAIDGAVSALLRDRRGLYRTGEAHRLHVRIKELAARRLIEAAGKVTELDADVLEDLMKIVKKLGKQTASNGNGLETRLKLTLDLLPYIFDKGKNTTPDMLLYRFNELYRGLCQSIPENAIVTIPKGGTK